MPIGPSTAKEESTNFDSKNQNHKAPLHGTKTLVTQTGLVTDEDTMKAQNWEEKLFHFYKGSETPRTAYVTFSYIGEKNYKMSIFSPKTKTILHDCQIKLLKNLKVEEHHVKWNEGEKPMILKCYKGHMPEENLLQRNSELAETVYSYILSLQNCNSQKLTTSYEK